MKKLLFVLAFTFIGGQAFSQMYSLSVQIANPSHPSNCPNIGGDDVVIIKIDPAGNATYTCVEQANSTIDDSKWSVVQQDINSILNLGYKVIGTPPDIFRRNSNTSSSLNLVTWYFAIPWTSSGLEEVATTLKSFIISPNPANTFVDISLDYSLKGESEVVFISEVGYISHKQSIGNIFKNEKYNIDISKIPTGKYLVTIVSGKTYTTPKKLIIF